MKKYLEPNSVFQEANATVKARGFLKVTLVFLLVYFAGSIINGVLSMIPTAIYTLTGQAYEDFTQTIEGQGVIALFDMYVPSWLTACNLLCTIGTIIAVIVYCTKFEHRRLFTLGFVKKGAVKEYLIGLSVGLIMFGCAYGIILLSGEAQIAINPNFSVGAIFFLFLGFAVQGMSEEVLLRGYYFVSAGCGGKITLAAIASSFIFAALHLANDGIGKISLINLYLFGVFAAIYFLRRGSIWGIGAIHTVWNFAQGNIFGCPVSGISAGDSFFITNYSYESVLFNGGRFGPEGGIGVTVVLVIAIIIVLFMKNKTVEAPEFEIEK